ncbi:MAG: alpha/beta fold hydrolase [Phormidesmis sp.]
MARAQMEQPGMEQPGMEQLGEQRVWYWRGWRIRYTHLISRPQVQGKTPLLLVHGAGSSLDQWRENLTVFAQERPVYAVDLLGFGGSQKVAITLNNDLWVAQVADFWQAFLGRPMILMGHSLGALVALQMAADYPKRVDRLVMLTLPAARQELGGTAAKVGAVVEGWFASPLLIRPLFWLLRRPRVIRGALRAIAQKPDRVDTALVNSFVRPTRDRGAARTFCYLVKSRTSEQFSPMTQTLIPQLQMPALLLWGKRDRIIPITWGRYVNRLTHRLTFVEVEEAGHFFYDELATEVHDLIDLWLTDQLPATNSDLVAAARAINQHQ